MMTHEHHPKREEAKAAAHLAERQAASAAALCGTSRAGARACHRKNEPLSPSFPPNPSLVCRGIWLGRQDGLRDPFSIVRYLSPPTSALRAAFTKPRRP